MWFLLGTTLTASFFDSLNPSAIAQQMLLQAMVKKKRHIWFFICGIGTANLIMGLAIYYGIATWVSKFLTKIVNAYMEKERPLPLLPITTARTFGLPTNYAVTENLNFYMQESKIIQEVAEKSDCVIVGRCADYVLRDKKPIRLFIYADMEYKIVRCKAKGDDIENLADPELRKKILSVDKKRSRYYQFYTNQVWGKKEHYDLCINTSRYAQIKEIIPGLTALVTM